MCVTSDFKKPGEFIYVLGLTRDEMGGSEIASQLNFVHDKVPHVEALTAKARYMTLNQAMRQRLVSSCHDLSDGGLGVALAEMSLGGRIGCEVDLRSVPTEYGMSTLSVLYSESASRLP